MDRWMGKVALVTGASAGIGLSTARLLLENGLVVVGLARRLELMEERMKDVKNRGKFYGKKCDVSNKEQVKMLFAWIKDTFKTIHILVNNAGILRMNSLIDMPIEDIELQVNLNLMGLIYCTREAGKLMKQNDEEAIIVNINSDVCNEPGLRSDLNVYPATKCAVKAISLICRKEFVKHKNIRVANVSPGLVATEIFESSNLPLEALEHLPALLPEDVANSILYIVSVPVHVNISELTLKPTAFSAS